MPSGYVSVAARDFRESLVVSANQNSNTAIGVVYDFVNPNDIYALTEVATAGSGVWTNSLAGEFGTAYVIPGASKVVTAYLPAWINMASSNGPSWRLDCRFNATANIGMFVGLAERISAAGSEVIGTDGDYDAAAVASDRVGFYIGDGETSVTAVSSNNTDENTATAISSDIHGTDFYHVSVFYGGEGTKVEFWVNDILEVTLEPTALPSGTSMYPQFIAAGAGIASMDLFAFYAERS